VPSWSEVRALGAWLWAGWVAALVGCGGDIGAPADEAPGSGGGPDGGAPAGAADAATADGAPDECVEGWHQLLVNPHFDEGPDVGWTSTGGDLIRREADMPIQVDSGDYAAWLGGRNQLDASLAQAIAVPEAASQLRLSARTCFVTVESSGTHDRVQVVLRDAAGAVAGTLSDFTNQDAGAICNWGSLEVSSSPAHAGEELTFELHVTTDAANHTSFYFDTLALEALTECGS
jgi:hypothetical protein